MLRVEALDSGRIEEAAAMFCAGFARLRREVPLLSPALENPALVARKLERMAGQSLAGVEDGRLIGYLTWRVVERFRGAPRRGAYVPEWGHAALPGRRAEIYRALYRAAAAEWSQAGCAVHGITLLANDEEAREAWFWNAFGLAVVDAVRATSPLDHFHPSTLSVRQATEADAAFLAELDAEHVRHYGAPPVFMASPSAEGPAEFAEFVRQPKNGIWLALDGAMPAGFMGFTGYDFDAVAALQSETAAFCNGAYVRPDYRGSGVGKALLQAALSHYASLGMNALYTNFESFNPEAASFWPRFFAPACLSLMRVPETAS